jgi:hypothetical protein
MLASTPIVYNKGKNNIFKRVDTHLTFLKDKNRKERINNDPKLSRQ